MSTRASWQFGLFVVLALQATAHAGSGYTFVKLVDHVEDNFSPRTLHCASLNESGEVAFKASRSAPDGLGSWDVIARVDRAGVMTTLVEDPARAQFQFFSNFVSLNDSGQVSFGAFRSDDTREIIRATGTALTTIASTAGEFSSLGFDTSLNGAGEVAFTARLDTGDQGLFSGAGGPVTTHYTGATPVLVDGVTTDLFGGNSGRPAINAGGEIAFHDRVEPSFAEGIFAGRSGLFRTLGPTGRSYNGAGDRGDPNLNDSGIGAFETSFSNDEGQFVTALATSNMGALSIVADTLNGYSGFGFYPPALNNRGQVAFRGFLNDFASDGIFMGPDPKKDAIITSNDKLDGARILSSSFSFCTEGLNEAGEVAFVVDVLDDTQFAGFRTVLYLATPKKPLAP